MSVNRPHIACAVYRCAPRGYASCSCAKRKEDPTMTTVMLDKRDEGVALITLNRPERLNAFGEDLLPRLVEALVDCEDDSEIRCVALTGAGRGFSAGADINNMSRSGGQRSGAGRGQPVEPPQSDADLGDAARDGHADSGAGQRSGRGRRSGPVPGDRLPGRVGPRAVRDSVPQHRRVGRLRLRLVPAADGGASPRRASC